MPPGALVLLRALSPSHLLAVTWACAHSKAQSLSDRRHIRPLPQGHPAGHSGLVILPGEPRGQQPRAFGILQVPGHRELRLVWT